MISEDDLPGFDLSWRVGTHEARTHFERVEESKMRARAHRRIPAEKVRGALDPGSGSP